MSANTMEVVKNGVSFKVFSNTSQAWWIWRDVINNSWEDGTFRVFDYFIKPDKSYLDIGAWIGPTVLYCAFKAKHVYAVEPDSAAFQELVSNLGLNPSLDSKVTCVNAALTDQSAQVRLYTKDPGDSLSSILPRHSNNNFTEVRGLTINDFVTEYKMKDIGFIKMDIEGGEYSLIPAMHDYLYNYRPTLYVSFHSFRLREEMQVKNSQNGIVLDCLNYLDDMTNKVLKSLEFYNYIYDSNGALVDQEEIIKSHGEGPFVFTDVCWK